MQDERIVRKVFSQVVAGYSLANLGDRDLNKIVYIKHLSPIDLMEFDFFYEEYLNSCINRGMLPESEKIKLLIRDNLWDLKRESNIEDLKDMIREAAENKRSHYNPKEIEGFNIQIKDYEDRLHKLLLDRISLIGDCAETFARRKIDLEQVFDCFFFDSEFKNKVYQDIEEIDEDLIDKVIKIYTNFNKELSDTSLKKVALSNEFQSLFNLTENLYYFYGTPIAKLTQAQSRLAGLGNYYKTILNSENRPPNKILQDPEKLEDWWFARNNINKLIESNNGENNNVNLVGISREELEYLGIKTTDQTYKIADAAKRLGKTELGKTELHELGLF